MHDGEAETGAAGEAAAERLEDPVDLVLGDADALVLDPDDQFASASCPIVPLLDAEAELAAVRHGANRVGRQVPDDLPDLVLVCVVPGLRRRPVDGDLVRVTELRVVLEQPRGIGYHLA